MNLLRISVFSLFFLLTATSTYSVSKATDVRFDNSKMQIVAPDAQSYAWYLNGHKLSETSAICSATQKGEYSVKMELSSGLTVVRKISVGVMADGTTYRIWTIGDSTMQEWGLPQAGWAQVLQEFFDEEHVTVINAGRSARSSKSYYDDITCSPSYMCWPDVVGQLQPNDFVVIQFGINDRYRSDPARFSDPNLPTSEVGSFKYNLKRYVDESIEKGAYPILVPPIRRNDWDGAVNSDGYGDYARATRELASELDIPLADLDSLGKIAMEEAGQDYTTSYWYMPSDVIHIQEMGAIKFAEMFVEGLKLNTEDQTIMSLVDHLSPTYEINITTNFPDDVLITRSGTLPAGLNFTLDAHYDDQSLVWAGWFEDNARFSYDLPYYLTVEDRDYTIEARLDDDFSKLDCMGFYEGGAVDDDCGACAGGTSDINPCYSGFANGQIVTLKPVHSQLCVTDGDILTQENCAEDGSQQWMLVSTGDFESVFKFQNVSSGLFIELNGNVLVHGETGVDWRIEESEPGVYKVAPVDNINSILSVSLKNEDPGARLSVLPRTNPSAGNLISISSSGVMNVEENAHGLYFPNPVLGGELHLVNSNKDISYIVLRDLGGKEVKKAQWEPKIDLRDVEHGIYLLQLFADTGALLDSTKIVIR